MMWGGAYRPGLVRSQDFCATEMMLNVVHCWRKKNNSIWHKWKVNSSYGSLKTVLHVLTAMHWFDDNDHFNLDYISFYLPDINY